jgi:hypothetical protein
MGEFIYYSSFDHARWFVDPKLEGIDLTAEVLDEYPGKRFEIKNWIESNCEGKVWMWNGVETPVTGEQFWGRKIIPQGGGTFFFEQENDCILFMMTWAPF